MANANPVADLIRTRLAGGARLPWEEVMRIALYEPRLGYYRRGVRSIGRGGDFFTSVSVGPVFGELLARFCARIWRSLGTPSEFAIIEQGAHEGRLAGDILSALEQRQPDLAKQLRYVIVEPDEELRTVQLANLPKWRHQVLHCADLKLPPGVPRHAVFLCNELIDAFPVHRAIFDAEHSAWREMFVEDSGGVLNFLTDDPTSLLLRKEMSHLPAQAPDNCTTEINLAMLTWLRDLAAAPFEGAVLILDYGFTEDAWTSGGHPLNTLRRYRDHQSDEHVLEGLGECDLTSNVNFTRLGREAESLGLPVLDFIEQGRFLTQIAAARLQDHSHPPDAAWLRQFQTLTHPGMMGRTFHALVLGKGAEASLLSTTEKQEAGRRRLGF